MRGLPPSSLTASAVRGYPWWGDTEHLLAGIFDLLAGANWQRGRKGSRPKPVKRPGEAQEKKYAGKVMSLDAARERARRSKAG